MRKLLVRVIVPAEGSSSPIRMRKRVVLPMPLGPTMRKPRAFCHRKRDAGKEIFRAEGFGEGGYSDEGHGL